MTRSMPDAKLPTLFKGCCWDDGWEFDMPCILYFPYKRYSPFGSNSSEIDGMVEDICFALALGEKVRIGWSDGEFREFAWRGWGPSRFASRKRAWHVTIRVKWKRDETGRMMPEFTKRTEKWGGGKK